jgi:hypothetical protein
LGIVPASVGVAYVVARRDLPVLGDVSRIDGKAEVVLALGGLEEHVYATAVGLDGVICFDRLWGFISTISAFPVIEIEHASGVPPELFSCAPAQ